MSGVTSNIQDQLNGKALSSHSHHESNYQPGEYTHYFVKFMSITITPGWYQNASIEFTLVDRNYESTKFSVLFTTDGNGPIPYFAAKFSGCEPLSKPLWVHRSNDSTIDFYTNCSNWGHMDLFDLRSSTYINIEAISYPNEKTTYIPEPYISAIHNHNYGDTYPTAYVTGQLFFLKSS